MNNVINKKIDAENISSISDKTVAILNYNKNYNGLIVTDAIDMDAGTIKAEAATPGVMFPVFGGYNDTGSAIIGSYDCSKVRKIEFEVKANRGGGTMTFASYLSGGEIKHTADEAIPTDFVKKSYAVTGADDVEILFYFNIGLPGKGLMPYVSKKWDDELYLNAGTSQVSLSVNVVRTMYDTGLI